MMKKEIRPIFVKAGVQVWIIIIITKGTENECSITKIIIEVRGKLSDHFPVEFRLGIDSMKDKERNKYLGKLKSYQTD